MLLHALRLPLPLLGQAGAATRPSLFVDVPVRQQVPGGSLNVGSPPARALRRTPSYGSSRRQLA
eukprot:304062-Chlamydomonas_euryale.AAC.22